MIFEYDASKSQVNKIKHGIDFDEAQEIWAGPYVEFIAKNEYESRYAVIGPIGKKFYTCIYTLRGASIRIISCRSARGNEKKLYEKNIS